MKEIDTGLVFKQIKKQNGEAVAEVLRSEVLLDIPNLAHILEFAGNNPDKIKALVPVIREIYKNKNRYNHTVNNPDATFNNNPDNIIPGLSTSLKKHFDVDFNASQSKMPNNFRLLHDQFVYFNNEFNNTYFGPDYYFSGNKITKLNTDYEVMMDYYILNIKTGTVQDIAGLNDSTYKTFQDIYGLNDSTYKIFQDIFRNKKITVRTSPNNKHERMIYADDTHVLSVEKGEITELNLPTIKNIGDHFLAFNKRLKKFYAPKLESVGDNFLVCNEQLTELDLPSLKTVGHHFVSNNTIITKFNAPLLEKTDHCFLKDNQGLTILELPSLRILSTYGLYYSVSLSKLYAPKLEKIGYKVMLKNQNLTELILPSLQEVGDNFLSENKKLKTFRAPKLKIIGEKFLASNTELTDFVAKNKDMLHKHDSNRRLIMSLAKNKLKQK
jgi:hypothetical protein